MKKLLAGIIYFAIIGILAAQTDECTIGAAVGRATADGRPLLWKTRDYLSEPDNRVQFITTKGYHYLAVTNDGTAIQPWMGVNQYGFAIINSNSTDLPDGSSTGPGNGGFMEIALGSCKTVEEFRALLDQTNITGRTTNANFGVIDTTVAAAIFETGHKVYWRYNADDEANGYVLRTNFAINGGGSAGSERFIRTTKLIGDFYSGDSLSHRSILRYQMRDFSDAAAQKVTVPYSGSWSGRAEGYIDNSISICRNSSVSASVIHGTLPGESARLSTLWTILGQPASSIAVPYWPVDATPYVASGGTRAVLSDVANQIRTRLYDLPSDPQYIDTYKLLNGTGEGLWTRTFSYEDRTLIKVGELMQTWRSSSSVPVAEMKYTQDTLADSTYDYLLTCYQYLLSGMTGVESLGDHWGHPLIKAMVYPNPFGCEATLQYEITRTSEVSIDVYTVTGKLIESASFPVRAPGTYEYILGSDKYGYPTGMLIIKLRANGFTRHLKVIRY